MEVNLNTLKYAESLKVKTEIQKKKKRKLKYILSPILILLTIFGTYFSFSYIAKENSSKIAKQLVQSVSVYHNFDAVKNAIDAKETSWEEVRSAMRQNFEDRTNSQVKKYFELSLKDREKYLDQIIVENQKLRPTTRPNMITTRPSREDRPRNDFQRNADNISPIDRAMRGEFFAALNKRMKEKGINVGWRDRNG
jgi:hypothetical protein